MFNFCGPNEKLTCLRLGVTREGLKRRGFQKKKRKRRNSE